MKLYDDEKTVIEKIRGQSIKSVLWEILNGLGAYYDNDGNYVVERVYYYDEGATIEKLVLNSFINDLKTIEFDGYRIEDSDERRVKHKNVFRLKDVYGNMLVITVDRETREIEISLERE